MSEPSMPEAAVTEPAVSDRVASDPPPARSAAGAATAAVIRRYEQAYLGQEGPARQALAHLRRGVAGNLAGSPASWPYVFQALSGDAPPTTNSGGASHTERAAHAALVLWAQHQQSRTKPVSVDGITLGRAAGSLSARLRSDGEPIDAGVLRRWARLTTATTFESQMRALTQLVSLMRANDVVLDYPRLASDIVRLQSPERRQDVLIGWARDLHRVPTASTEESEAPEAASPAQEQE